MGVRILGFCIVLKTPKNGQARSPEMKMQDSWKIKEELERYQKNCAMLMAPLEVSHDVMMPRMFVIDSNANTWEVVEILS